MERKLSIELILHYAKKPPLSCKTEKQNDACERVCEYINKHFAKNLSLEMFSKIACLSPFHFQRIFLKNIGVSPHEYLIKCRIDKAQELLKKGYHLIDVAYDTGFADQSHFLCYSKCITGIPPGKYISLNKN